MNIIYCIHSLKEKIHVILLVDVEKAFDKIIKTLKCNKNYGRNYFSYGNNHSIYHRGLWRFKDFTYVKILTTVSGIPKIIQC